MNHSDDDSTVYRVPPADVGVCSAGEVQMAIGWVDSAERLVSSMWAHNPQAVAFLRAQVFGPARRAMAAKPVLDATPDGMRFEGERLPGRQDVWLFVWLVVGAQQTGEPAPAAAALFPRRAPAACARQVFARAADRVERAHPVLAAAVRGIGTESGQLVLKTSLHIACRASIFERELAVNSP